jgi:hypothetical protein
VLRETLLRAAVVSLVLALVGPGRADNQKAARAVIAKAIKAAGGEAKLKKLQAATWKSKGKIKEGGQEISFTMDASAQGLDRCRLELSAEVNGMARTATLVFNKGKAWGKGNNQVRALPKEAVPIIQGNAHALRLAQLLYPLKDKAYKLTSLGELKIGNNQTVGIKAARKGFPEVDIYFDKKSGLPAKVRLTVKEREGEKAHEWLLSDPKDMAGVKHFSKIKFTRDGKEMMEVDLSDLKAKTKFEASTFAKPE